MSDRRFEILKRKFDELDIELRFIDKPKGRGRNLNNIVQIDIGNDINGTRIDEWFEIFFGDAENEVQILNIDKESQQFVLFVNENERTFEYTEEKSRRSDFVKVRRNVLQRTGVNFRETDTEFIITEKTSGRKEHYLGGVDERQLFISQLRTPCSTVADAKLSLGASITFSDGKRKMTPPRQGEYFFVETNQNERDIVNFLLDKNRVFIERKKNLGEAFNIRNGNQHQAEEFVGVPVKLFRDSKLVGQLIDAGLDISPFTRERSMFSNGGRFVRGRLRHVSRSKTKPSDHRTIKYLHWRKVVLNSEARSTQPAYRTWVD